MAANEVKLTIRVGDDGSLDVVARKAKKAAKETEKLTKSTEETSKARGRYHKGEKGVAQATANGTKAFSKQRDLIGGGSSGLVGAYATLAANVFALSAAFGVLQRAAAVQQLEAGLITMGQQSGIAMRALSSSLKEATGNAIALEEAMRSTSMVIGAGFDSSTLDRLGTVARNASIALGRDTADSLARLTRGAVKLEPELLDELGIMVRLDEATQEYAKSIGKTATALTSFEKRQAFMNAVLEEGERKYKALNGTVATNPYDQLAAAFSDLAKTLTTFANDTLKVTVVVKALADNTLLLSGALLFLGKSAIGSAIGALLPFVTNLSAGLALGAVNAAKMSASKAKLSATTIKGTKSVNNYADSLAKGERSQKGFAKAMRFGNQSLTSRIGYLKNHIKENGLFNKTTLTKVAGVKAASSAVNSLAMAEYKAATATAAHREQKIFAELALGNFSRAFKRLGIQFERYNRSAKAAAANATLSGKAFIFAGNAAKKAGLGLRFLGASALALLPHLGLILLVLGALKMAAEALYAKFYETEALRAFTEQSKKTTEVLNELAGAMESLPEQKLFSDQVIARANALNTAVAELDALIQKYSELKVEPLDDRLFRNLDKIDARVLLGPILAIPGLLQDKENRTSIADLLGIAGFKTTSQEAIAALEGFINSSPELVKNFETIFKGKTLQELLIGPDGKFDFALVKEIKERVIEGERQKADALSVVAKASRAASKALKDYLANNIVTTEFDEVSTAAKDFELALKNATDGKAVRQLVSELTPMTQRFYGISDVVSKELVGGFDTIYKRTGHMLMDYDAYLQALKDASAERAKQIAQDREIVSLGKLNLSDAKNKLNLEKQRTIFSGRSKAIDDATNAVVKEQLEVVDAQLRQKRRLFNAMSKEEQLSLSGKTIQAEINELLSRRKVLKASEIDQEEKLVNKAKETLDLLKAQQDIDKASLNVYQKQLDSLNLQISARKQLAEQAIREQNRNDPRRNRDDSIDPFQNYQITKDLEEDRLNAIDAAFTIEVKRIGMEYDLLDAQYRLLKAEAENINAKAVALGKEPPINTVPLDRAINSLASAEQRALNAAGASFTAQYRAVIEETTQAGANAIKEGLRSLFTDKNSIDKATTFFGNMGANLDPNSEEGKDSLFNKLEGSEKLQAMRGMINEQIEGLRLLGPEGELVGAVTQGAFTIGEAFLGATEQIAGLGEGAGSSAQKAAIALEAVSATMATVSAIMNASSQARIASIDREIAAEKKRDGKSAASVARINALEKKKDKEKRKAFEQNKKMQMAQVAINTAMAISANVAAASGAAAASGPAAVAVFSGTLGMLNGITLALGAAQMALIASTSYQGGGGTPSAGGGVSSVNVGQRKSSVDMARSQGGGGELAYFRGARGQGGPENFTPAFAGYKNRAEGGNTAFMVGEQGPELFVPERPGRIIPSDDVTAPTPVNANISISAIDAAGVEDVLMNQRGNIISMIRDAANSQGNTFLEEINVAEL